MTAWQIYLILLGAGVKKLPDGRHLAPSCFEPTKQEWEG